jgi:hypothetical protein
VGTPNIPIDQTMRLFRVRTITPVISRSPLVREQNLNLGIAAAALDTTSTGGEGVRLTMLKSLYFHQRPLAYAH